MRKTKATGDMSAILLDRETLYKYLNAGRTVSERIAKESGAIRHYGRAVRYYRPAIDEYVANINRCTEG